MQQNKSNEGEHGGVHRLRVPCRRVLTPLEDCDVPRRVDRVEGAAGGSSAAAAALLSKLGGAALDVVEPRKRRDGGLSGPVVVFSNVNSAALRLLVGTVGVGILGVDGVAVDPFWVEEVPAAVDDDAA